MNLNLLWMLAASLGGLLAGIGVGFYLGRGSGPDARRLRDLARTLDSTEKDYAAFRQQVQRHFARTAELAADAAAGQRSLHEHLARGAHALAGQVLEPAAAPAVAFPTRPQAPPATAARGAPKPATAAPAGSPEPAAPRHPAMAAPVDFPRS